MGVSSYSRAVLLHLLCHTLERCMEKLMGFEQRIRMKWEILWNIYQGNMCQVNYFNLHGLFLLRLTLKRANLMKNIFLFQ